MYLIKLITYYILGCKQTRPYVSLLTIEASSRSDDNNDTTTVVSADSDSEG